jgi:hypothetical protein
MKKKPTPKPKEPEKPTPVDKEEAKKPKLTEIPKNPTDEQIAEMEAKAKAAEDRAGETMTETVQMDPKMMMEFMQFIKARNAQAARHGEKQDLKLAKFTPIKNETPEMLDYFEYWYNNGAEEPRSQVAVARHFNKARKTIQNYYYSFNWEQRRADRLKRQVATVKSHKEQGTLNSILSYREVFSTLLDKARQDIVDGKLKIRSIKDLSMMADIEVQILQADVERERTDQLAEGKLGSLVDVLNHMPMTPNPDGTGTRITQTIDIDSIRKSVDPQPNPDEDQPEP